MTDAPIHSPPASTVLPYRASSITALARPNVAAIGFLLIGLSPGPAVADTLRINSIPPLQFLLDRFSYPAERFILIAGVWMVIRAFRGSTLLPPFLRAALIVVAGCYTAFTSVYVYNPALHDWGFSGPATLDVRAVRFLLAILLNVTLALLLLLLLILLQRIGRTIRSRMFRTISALILLARILLMFLWMTLNTLNLRDILNGSHGTSADLVALRYISDYGSCCSAALLFALAVWCIAAARTLGQTPMEELRP